MSEACLPFCSGLNVLALDLVTGRNIALHHVVTAQFDEYFIGIKMTS